MYMLHRLSYVVDLTAEAIKAKIHRKYPKEICKAASALQYIVHNHFLISNFPIVLNIILINQG